MSEPAPPAADPSPPPTTGAVPASLRPISASERIEIVDVLRGLAIFGILLVNMPQFAGPFLAMFLNQPLWPDTGDRLVTAAVTLLAQGKFYALFSFLFGFGIAMQQRRCVQRGAPFLPFYSRRLLVLLLIGLIHATLIWNGDILVSYAVLGFVLLILRESAPRTLLITAFAAFGLQFLLNGTCMALAALGGIADGTGTEVAGIGADDPRFVEIVRNSIETYSSGTWREILLLRLDEWGIILGVSAVFMWPTVFAMFVLGMLAERRHFFERIADHRGPAARWTVLLGVLGLLTMFPFAWLAFAHDVSPLMLALAMPLSVIGGPALCCAYIGVVVLLWRSTAARAVLRGLAPVGRMALSNYLLQSVVCTLLFYSYGLGYFGRVSPRAGLLLTICLFAVQIILSHIWLGRFRYGPLEWLWRSASYRRWQPLLR